MIKFFRNIRKRLLIDNNFSKYLIYAIGEIFLVVIGILIALWLNNLNNNQQNRIKEISILNGLKEDMIADIIDFQINKTGYQAIITSADLILEMLESATSYNDSLDRHFALTGCWPKSILHRSSFDVLKSKGLDLISNDTLRLEILHYYDQTLTSIHIWETEYSRDIYFDEIIKRFDRVEPWKATESGKIVYGRMKPNNFNALKTDMLYKSILRTSKRDAEQLLYSNYKTIIGDLENLINNIDQEIAKLE